MNKFDIWYMKPSFFPDGIMGFDWCFTNKLLPDPGDLSKTHVMLKTIDANDLEDVFQQMQGEQWSPNGEARPIILSKGLQHTSMSVGDIAVGMDQNVWMIDNLGFKNLSEVATDAYYKKHGFIRYDKTKAKSTS